MIMVLMNGWGNITNGLYYITPDGSHRIMRESGQTPNGNHLNNRWVYRNLTTNELIDFDSYRSDLFERHDITVTVED